MEKHVTLKAAPSKKTARVARNASPESVARRNRQIVEKRKVILQAALKLFSKSGIHGSSLEEVAKLADVSKTNVLYYFPNKEALYVALLSEILAVWLEPLRTFSVDQEPEAAIAHYIRRKMIASRDSPEASRLFCLELVQGAPLFGQEIKESLNALVAEKAKVIEGWIAAGQLADVDPRHFLFSLWSTTQHYADFSFQVQALTGKSLKDRKFFEEAVGNVQRIILGGVLTRTPD